ncbi:TolC family protein [Thiomicrorhabdus sp. Kp2]|uniref:TolC family protein n=1 Tax=Thiomicrorhabdus sp. Kp2 TaxID=1123518 RepID=UPI0003F624BE|nr:TolC family protein [Thiomicrorhabdus sp. Kp2]
MKQIQILSLTGLFLFGLTSHSAQAASYADLLEQVMQKQPEQMSLIGYDAVETSANDAANSLFSSNTNLVIAHENDAMTGDLDKTKWHIGAEFPLWLPGQADSQQQLAKGYSELKNDQINFLKWQASGQLRDLVWQYREAQVQTDIAQKSVAQANKLHLLISKLVQVGEKPKMDALMAQNLLLTAESHLLTMQNQLGSVQKRYQSWTGSLELPIPLTENAPLFDINNHPELRKLNAELAILQAELQTLKVSQKDNPVLSVGGFQEEDRAMSPNTTLFAQISYPIGSNPSKKVETAKQNTQVLNKEAEVKRYQLELQNRLYASEQSVVLAEQKLTISAQNMQLAEQTLQLAQQAYQAGESNIQTLVNAQQVFLDSELQQALIQIEMAKAIANRNQIAGVSL